MSPSPVRPGPVLCVVGARPNFIKIEPILRAFARHEPTLRPILVHTGQHYDAAMSDRLFADLQLAPPEVNLGVGSGSHSMQTAEILRRFEPIVDAHRPSCVLVVGDVNSTLACSLVAAKRGVAIAHVEAGLRSYDRTMPEEINRLLTDQIADVLYTTERTAEQNLLREGISTERIHFVGNVMIDALLAHRIRAPKAADVLRHAGASQSVRLVDERYAVVTLHRPANVDAIEALREALETLRMVSEHIPLICVLHPRTQQNIARFELQSIVASARIAVLSSVGYLDMLGLVSHAALVLTDSGGLQEETTALGVPCLTMRENTERPITVQEGTNTLVGRAAARVLPAVNAILTHGGKGGRTPERWDGHAAERIVAHLASWLSH